MMKDNCNCNSQNNWQNQGMNRNCGRADHIGQRGGYGMDASCGRESEPNHDPCYHKELPVDRIKPGMGYVPWQNFENVLCAKDGLAQGTIFGDLILPFYGSPIHGRNVHGNSGNGRRCR